MTEIVPNTSKHLNEMIQEQEEAIARCGPKLYRITREGGITFLYHNNILIIEVLPENVLTDNNIVLANEIDDFLIEYSKIYPLVTCTLPWEKYNRNAATSFLDWMAENHPEYEFKAEYIGPEMKDTRTKFGEHIENGERIIYN
ncbi:MAG: hypothetical protein Q4G68_13475 [Planctomycetia bacterium]|nr:hypothetical protein [Planctomycetia bacterium]